MKIPKKLNSSTRINYWLRFIYIVAPLYVIFALGFFWYYASVNNLRIPFIQGYLNTNLATPPASDVIDQTEVIFQRSISKPSNGDEWWDARSDHRLIAYAILNCKKISNIDTISRQTFNALLLDLTPNGNHEFSAPNPTKTDDSKLTPFVLSAGERDLLTLSDSISRARMTAARGAAADAPWVQRLGIATLIVSAFATLFVTLQGKMKPPPEAGEKNGAAKTPLGRFLDSIFGLGGGFKTVAFLAIFLSIAGTTLTGVKQFYDPTRTLVQNTRALLELRRLHQTVSLGLQCKADSIEASKKADWSATIERIRGQIFPDYGAYATIEPPPAKAANTADAN